MKRLKLFNVGNNVPKGGKYVSCFLLAFLILIIGKGILAEDLKAVDSEKGKELTVSIKYENGLLSADLKSATIKDIFEELKKQTGTCPPAKPAVSGSLPNAGHFESSQIDTNYDTGGFGGGINYEIEKEILEQKVTITLKEKELTQAIKDILNTIGNPSYVINYKKGKDGKDEIAGINITKRGKTDLSEKDLGKMDLTELMKDLKDRNNRLKALEEIKKRGKESVPVLIEIAKDKLKPEEEKIIAIMLIGELKSKEAVPIIENILKQDKNEYCREASVLALAEIGETTSMPLIKEGLNDESGNVRQRSVLALAKLGDKSHSDIALKGIREGNPTEKMLATMALEEVGDTGLIKELTKELESEDVKTRINVKLAIKKIEYKNINDEKKLEYLKETLKDHQFEVNSWAAEELLKIDSGDSIKILEETSKNEKIAGSYSAWKAMQIKMKEKQEAN